MQARPGAARGRRSVGQRVRRWSSAPCGCAGAPTRNRLRRVERSEA